MASHCVPEAADPAPGPAPLNILVVSSESNASFQVLCAALSSSRTALKAQIGVFMFVCLIERVSPD